jgi:hypothetical protein
MLLGGSRFETTSDTPPNPTMVHPLARTLPSLEQLIKQHAYYMTRLPESERNRSAELTASLNMTALQTVAGKAIGSTCHKVDKIYEGLDHV